MSFKLKYLYSKDMEVIVSLKCFLHSSVLKSIGFLYLIMLEFEILSPFLLRFNELACLLKYIYLFLHIKYFTYFNGSEQKDQNDSINIICI